MVVVNENLSIPEEEFEFSFVRSGGPGGQKVNKTSSKALVQFNVDASPSLTEGQKARIKQRLANRMNSEGVLLLAAQDQRSQTMNRESALERLAALLAEALKVQKRRRPTRVPRGAVERRLEGKRQQSQKKRERSGRED
jgi:ribosome-associated protein